LLFPGFEGKQLAGEVREDGFESVKSHMQMEGMELLSSVAFIRTAKAETIPLPRSSFHIN
jgi:hypothetical protein